jgi:hypothetical protein
MSKVYALTKTALAPLKIPLFMITCASSTRPDEYITYTIIDAPNKTGSDGIVTGTSIRIQVDYMTKKSTNIESKGSQIEDLMLQAGFLRVGNSRDNYDFSSGYYYRQQDFRYYERR